ncbi:helix-turn-helix transcriptional regulator [Actinokineospora sp. 24-640]
MASALVGRTDQVTFLRGKLREATEGQPSAVVLAGEPGVGKTRLVAEFTEAARASGAVVLAGGCVGLVGGSMPYEPLVRALVSLVRRVGHERARGLAGPAWRNLEGLISDFTGVGEQAPAGPGAQTKVFGALAQMLDNLGGGQPLLLVFEDMHWADTATLDLFAHLVGTMTDQRLMLVCTHRSVLPYRHALRQRLREPSIARRVDRIDLKPFEHWEFRLFVNALTDGAIAPELADRYYALSEGNPYYAEQLVAAGPIAALPDSLGDLMRDRITHLGEDAARVVRAAAVAGRTVAVRFLARVVALDEDALDAALTECIEHGVLLEDQEEESYTFEHALLRETVYSGVRPLTRKRLHATLAAALAEDVASDPKLLPELAYHWAAAESVPDALRASVAAGDLAYRVRAFAEAETQYRRALDLWDRVPDAEVVVGAGKVTVLTRAADAARWAGHLPAAAALAEEAVGAVANGDPVVSGSLYERLACYLWEAGEDARSAQAYRDARRVLKGTEPSETLSRVYSALATIEVSEGRAAEGLTLARRAAEIAEAADSSAAGGRARNSLGVALCGLGKVDDGVAALCDAVRTATEVDHLEDFLRARVNLGACLYRAGRVAEAAEEFLAAFETTRRLGLQGTREASLSANNACATLIYVGRWAQASTLIEEILLYYPSAETVMQQLTKVELDMARGDLDAAGRALKALRAHTNLHTRFVSPLYRLSAELAAGRGDLGDALDTIANGLAAVKGSDDPFYVLNLCEFGLRAAADAAALPDSPWAQGDLVHDMAWRAEAAGRQGQGDPEVAALAASCAAEDARRLGVDSVATWASLAAVWADLGRPYSRAYALLREAWAALRADDRTHALAVATEAAEIAERLGARPLSAEIATFVDGVTLKETPAKAPSSRYGLTLRELQVLDLADRGLTSKEIAKALGIARGTVSAHRQNSISKTESANTIEAVGKARAAGLIPLAD